MIKFKCTACGEGMSAPDSIVGEKLACPACGQERKVPKSTPKYARPTDTQIELATLLGLSFADDISKQELSALLSKIPQENYPVSQGQCAFAAQLGLKLSENCTRGEYEKLKDQVPKSQWPATERQKQFARNIGITFKDDISCEKISTLLDKKLAKMPPSEGQLQWAENQKIEVPRDCSYKQMSEIINSIIEEEEKKREKYLKEKTENEEFDAKWEADKRPVHEKIGDILKKYEIEDVED